MSAPVRTEVDHHVRRRRIDALWLVACAILLAAIRLHAFGVPLETDECNHAYIAGRLLAGDRLYTDVWNHHAPGIYVIFATAIAAFGDGPTVFRWTALAFCLATMPALSWVGRRVGGPWAARLAVLLFALSSADPGIAGEGCNREVFMNLFAVLGVGLALDRRGRRWPLILAGTMFGLGSLLKPVMAAPWMTIALWRAGCVVRRGGRDNPDDGMIARGQWRNALLDMVCFGVGPAILWGVTFGYFALTDRASAFIDAVFRFNVGYGASSEAWWQRFVVFFHPTAHPNVFAGIWPLCWAGGLAAAALAIVALRGAKHHIGILPAFLAGSYLAVCLPGQFWPHYYYLTVPPAVLCAACGFAALGRAALNVRTQVRRPTLRRVSAAALPALLVGLLAWTQARDFVLRPVTEITRHRYHHREYWVRDQAARVARCTEPNDAILVYGDDPGIYYYSGRRCASRYTLIRPLREQYEDHDRRRQQLLDDLRRRRPRLVLLVEQPFGELEAWLKPQYVVAATDWLDRTNGVARMYVLVDRRRPVRTEQDWTWQPPGDNGGTTRTTVSPRGAD